jgi:NMD protein affecting ribosome stability and mRNA decay
MKNLNLRPRKPPTDRRTAGRAQLDQIADPYQLQQKPQDGTACPQCGVAFTGGRWSWRSDEPPTKRELCPACRRINERFPAGVLTLKGPFVREHRDELVRMARHQETLEKDEHPMNRIMAVEELDDGLEIATTDIHLPKRIGELVKRTWKGRLATRFEKDGYFVRVSWTREA